jgi:hypothetical protein
MAFGIGPSFKPRTRYQDTSTSGKKEEKKKTPAELFEEARKKTEGLRTGIQKMGERQKAEEEEKKKKKAIEPTKGFMGRMLDKYWYKKKEE